MLIKKYKILIIILLIAAILGLNKFGGERVRNTFYLISSPLSKIFWRAGEGVSNFFGAAFKINILKKESEAQQQQNLMLLKELANLRALREENKTLREALNLGLEEKFKLFLTEVIAEEKEQNSILITGGAKNGISENMPVITNEGVLVGKIKESFSDFSKVILITNPKNAFDVEIGGDETVLGIAKGKGNLRIELQLVPQEKQLKIGDVVLTTTLGGNFPKGLLVGEVSQVRKSAPEPFQGGEIEPYFTKAHLRFLFVIKKVFEKP